MDEFRDLSLNLRIAATKPFSRERSASSAPQFCAHPQYSFVLREETQLRYCGLRAGSQSSEVQYGTPAAEIAVSGLGEREIVAHAVSSTSRFVVAAAGDGAVLWWDSSESKATVRELPSPNGAAPSPLSKGNRKKVKKAARRYAMRRVFVSADGTAVVAFDRLCEFHLWDMRSPRPLQRWCVFFFSFSRTFD